MVHGGADEQRRPGDQVLQPVPRLGQAPSWRTLAGQQWHWQIILVWLSPQGSCNAPLLASLQVPPSAIRGILHSLTGVLCHMWHLFSKAKRPTVGTPGCLGSVPNTQRTIWLQTWCWVWAITLPAPCARACTEARSPGQMLQEARQRRSGDRGLIGPHPWIIGLWGRIHHTVWAVCALFPRPYWQPPQSQVLWWLGCPFTALHSIHLWPSTSPLTLVHTCQCCSISIARTAKPSAFPIATHNSNASTTQVHGRHHSSFVHWSAAHAVSASWHHHAHSSTFLSYPFHSACWALIHTAHDQHAAYTRPSIFSLTITTDISASWTRTISTFVTHCHLILSVRNQC